MNKEHPQQVSHPRLSREDWHALAIQLLKSCGYGRVLVVGLQDPELMCELLRQGVDVTGLASTPEAFSTINAVVPGRVRIAVSTDPLPLDRHESFDTVVFLADSSVPDAWRADERLPQQLIRSGRCVLLALLEGGDSHEARAVWDERFSSAGARRHPLSHEVAPYGGLDELSGMALLLYERVPEPALSAVSLNPDVVSAQGFGGEEDARAARYELGARFVRSGDRVLDTASPVGVGAYLLSRETAASIVGWSKDSHVASQARAFFASTGNVDLTFEEAPQHGMQSLAPGSFDFIVADSGLNAPDLSWSEARRVLTPAGRIYVCHRVEEGADEGLGKAMQTRLESSGLLLERSWLQHAQSTRLNGVGGRHVEEVPTDGMSPAAGDWILILAMKSVADYAPCTKQIVRDVHSPNVIAFSRDYENPWLVRGLVAMGLRATSMSVRIAMADDVLAVAADNSADHGAALCVRCYAELEKESSAEVLRHWLQRAWAFTEILASNPTALRWQISLLFVAGQMAMRIGDLVQAESAFARIGDLDALKFSPLLGTKTVGAALRCGTIAFARGDKVGARRGWTRALLETRRLLRDGDWREIIVDNDRPETFGLPEVAAFVMEGARAAGGLRALQDYPDKPSLVWQALHGTQVDMLQAKDLELRSLRRWWEDHERQRDAGISQLNEGKAWLEQQLASWEAEARTRGDRLEELAGQLSQMSEGGAWLEQQLASWEAEARTRGDRLEELAGQLSQMSDNMESVRHDNSKLLMRRQQLEHRVEALQGEVHALARTSVEESRRRRSIESSWFVRLGGKLGLIRSRG